MSRTKHHRNRQGKKELKQELDRSFHRHRLGAAGLAAKLANHDENQTDQQSDGQDWCDNGEDGRDHSAYQLDGGYERIGQPAGGSG